MPRLRQSVPKYRLHRASGRAVVTFDGRDHYLGAHGSDESIREYDRLIAEYLGSGRNSVIVNRGFACSVAELLDAFLTHAEAFYQKGGQPTTELFAYRRVIGCVISMYALQDAAHFGPVALKGIRETWVRAGYSRSTINKDQRRLVRIWKWGVGEELVPPDAWQALAALEGLRKGRTLAPEPVHVPPVDIARVQATIPHLSPIVADMVRLQLLTGCRPGEVCRLRPCDIDRSGDVWEYSPAGHKTEHHGRSRTVYLGPQAKAILAPYLFGDASQACFSPSDSAEWFRERRAAARKTPPSCGNRRGKRSQPPARSRKPRRPRGEYDASSYCQAIHLACRKAWPASRETAADPAKLRAWTMAHRWSPNQLRHTKATEIRRLYGIEAAQTILGHASIDVTQIYAEQDREQARSIVRAIG